MKLYILKALQQGSTRNYTNFPLMLQNESVVGVFMD